MRQLHLTVCSGQSVRSVKSVVNGDDVQAMIALFTGHTVLANVYSGTNKCFDVTEEMIRYAWETLDKEIFFWVNAAMVEHLIERFTVVGDNGHTLAMGLPNLHCFETPAEIETMLA
jgi:hypothetical protein